MIVGNSKVTNHKFLPQVRNDEKKIFSALIYVFARKKKLRAKKYNLWYKKTWPKKKKGTLQMTYKYHTVLLSYLGYTKSKFGQGSAYF